MSISAEKIKQMQEFTDQHSIEEWVEILKSGMINLQSGHVTGTGISFSFNESIPVAHLVLSDYLPLVDIIGSLAAYYARFKNGPEERITFLELCHYLSKVLEKIIVKIPFEEKQEIHSSAPKSNLH